MAETRIDDQGRAEPPTQGDEWETLSGFLDFQRATFEWKTAGLESEQLGRAVASSTMTLGGMMKHLASVEDHWFGNSLWNEPEREPWASVDWAEEPDWDWHSAADDSPEELRRLWAGSVDRARDAAARAYADKGLARVADEKRADGFAPSLRWILTHMVEEYARHNGHADLIRESLDGRTGE
ncbi:DinB family protein [Spelaeicoccus albus]|uniref:Putative damage-inducible protein DinB n=1 Tax=Spelaeicoccus albus TaxID=1280376 RepID=A0A7Z0CZ23_9MICO|nr:DinB family protein [Spelaeicoccus albus]NYI65829.1 putative damage-inducible protein DinB [Spelaeicoccus albus]